MFPAVRSRSKLWLRVGALPRAAGLNAPLQLPHLRRKPHRVGRMHVYLNCTCVQKGYMYVYQHVMTNL